MIKRPQKLSHAVDLIVVLADREHGNLGLKGSKPRRRLGRIDHTLLDFGGLMRKSADLVAFRMDIKKPGFARSMQILEERYSTSCGLDNDHRRLSLILKSYYRPTEVRIVELVPEHVE